MHDLGLAVASVRVETAVLQGQDRSLDFNMYIYYSFVYIAFGGELMTVLIRHKHLKLDQRKIDQAKEYLGVKTESEAIDQALEFLIAEKTINAALRKIKGKGQIEKVFN